jgi:hypothetical protein
MSFTPFPVPCSTVFSFSLYGDNSRYTIGMIKNAEHIPRRFPGAEVWIYIADDVPTPIRDTLQSLPAVRLLDVTRRKGLINSFDRFIATDDIPVEGVVFFRDADSRVHERDSVCIEDFLLDPIKQLHIIRDHRYHTQHIMAGMWGMRRDTSFSMKDKITENTDTSSYVYLGDQIFLHKCIYPRYKHSVMIHDDHYHIDPTIPRTPFRVPIIDHQFVGQAYTINEDGSDKPLYV